MSIEPVSRRDQARPPKPPPPPGGLPQETNWARIALVACLVVTIVVSLALRLQPPPPEPSNMAGQYNDVLPLDRLESVGDPGWIGILGAGSVPATPTLVAACAAFQARLHMIPGQTVRLLTSDGAELYACGEQTPR